ncbi:MAG: zinc-ribbon domain-containing protein, partial [Oscillospiraceae bacterium]
MAFCTNCGAKLADDAKFCTECGAQVGRVPPEPTNPQITPVGDPTPAAPASAYTYSAAANDYAYTPAPQDS